MDRIEAPKSIDAQEVKRSARELGADLVGVASAEDFGEALPGCRPRDLFGMANSVIVMAKRIPFAAATPYPSIAAMEFGEYIPENFLNEACYRLSLFLEDSGYLSGPRRRVATSRTFAWKKKARNQKFSSRAPLI